MITLSKITTLVGPITSGTQTDQIVVADVPPDPDPTTGVGTVSFFGSNEVATYTGWTCANNSLWRYVLVGVVRGASPATYVKGSSIVLSGIDNGTFDRVEADKNFQPFSPIRGY